MREYHSDDESGQADVEAEGEPQLDDRRTVGNPDPQALNTTLSRGEVMAELHQLNEVFRSVGRQYHRKRRCDPCGVERVPQRRPDPPETECECSSMRDRKQHVEGQVLLLCPVAYEREPVPVFRNGGCFISEPAPVHRLGFVLCPADRLTGRGSALGCMQREVVAAEQNCDGEARSEETIECHRCHDVKFQSLLY